MRQSGAPANTEDQMTQTTHPLLAGLADVALIDAETSARIGSMSASWWLEEVRRGRAPAPAIREHRCTRWRLADVRAFWAARASAGPDPQKAQAVFIQATKASKASNARRTEMSENSAAARALAGVQKGKSNGQD